MRMVPNSKNLLVLRTVHAGKRYTSLSFAVLGSAVRSFGLEQGFLTEWCGDCKRLAPIAQMFSIEVSSSYGMTNWHDDLKLALRASGEKGKNAVFIFSDSQILDETMVGILVFMCLSRSPAFALSRCRKTHRILCLPCFL